MRIWFCGVRGSTPAPGREFIGVGGHTSCLAIASSADGPPGLVLDAGTGIRTVTDLLGDEPFRGTVVLSHLHWDHVQGLPFFAAADRHDARTRLLLPSPHADPTELLARALSPPHFPIGPAGLQGSWSIGRLDEGSCELEGLRVTACRVPHKGGPTFGLRVDGPGGSLAYVPDHLPAASPPSAELAALVARVDLLVHDAEFTAGEAELARRYGHSTVDQAVSLARSAEVGELVLFHHAPGRTDAEVDALLAMTRASAPDVTVSAARQGDTRSW